jgi:hypothetical protein
MKRISRLIDWFADFWPIIFIIVLIILHLLLLNFFSNFTQTINTVISSLTQLAGGIITLIIVSKNFSQFRNMNLFSWLKRKIKAFPWKKQHYILQAESSQIAMTVGKPHLSELRKWDTVEEGLQELERRIFQLQKEMNDRYKDLQNEITVSKRKLKGLITENSQKLNDVQKLLEISVLDDMHIQIFGALLILYGFFVDNWPIFFR